jgi:hypothetical protein
MMETPEGACALNEEVREARGMVSNADPEQVGAGVADRQAEIATKQQASSRRLMFAG